MYDRLDPGMREAARLTRAGRLTEATALLQRMLYKRSGPYPASGTGSAPPTFDLAPETVEITNPAPSLRNGQEFDAGIRDRDGRAGRAYLPETLRRLFDRMPRTGFEPGPGGRNPLQPRRPKRRKAANSSFGPIPTRPEPAPTSSTCRAAIAAGPCR